MSNLSHKMNALINNVCTNIAERDELIKLIAIALLTRRNLFILGDVGQAKSDAVNQFRKRIMGTKQFYHSMSKQTDEEQLFGRLDLASLVPGSVPRDLLELNELYCMLRGDLQDTIRECSALGEAGDSSGNGNASIESALREKLNRQRENIEEYAKALAVLHGGMPRLITTGKIPDCHIAFLDEIFKSSEALLNSLLEITIQHTFTNEGVSIDTPLISVFSASNEIPNFSDPTDKSLRALYDRFELKITTRYIQERSNRLAILNQKQSPLYGCSPVSTITLEELLEMQKEVKRVKISEEINLLMDDLLCALRQKGLHISDRTYFGFFVFVQAQAWLDGRDAAEASDLNVLRYAVWNTPEELDLIDQTLITVCQDPLTEQIRAIRTNGQNAYNAFQSGIQAGNTKPTVLFSKIRTDLMAYYEAARYLKDSNDADRDYTKVDMLLEDLDGFWRDASRVAGFSLSKLEEQIALRDADQGVA